MIDMEERQSIGTITFFSSFNDSHGAINTGPHIVVTEKRIE